MPSIQISVAQSPTVTTQNTTQMESIQMQQTPNSTTVTANEITEDASEIAMSEPGTPLSAKERFKIGPSYYPEVYLSCSPLGKVIFVVRVLTSLIEAIIGIGTLIITRDQNPDIPLFLLVLAYTILESVTVIFFPFYFTISQATHEITELVELEDHRRSLQSFIDSLFIVPFVTGFALLCTTSATRNLLFVTGTIYITLGLAYMCFPAIIAIIAVLCLPCLYLLFRNASLREEARIRAMGASDELISAFPIFTFRKKSPGQVDIEAPLPESVIQSQPNPQPQPSVPESNPEPEQSQPPPKPEKKRRRFRLFSRSNKKDGSSTSPTTTSSSTKQQEQQFLELETDDAVCSICLSEYEEGEFLRQLGCKHHFHKDCIDEWLHRNGKCPLCVQGLEEVPYTK
ncbi:hypothetical protein BC833DRAFT_624601 [Globomyces pollinis-pini]|nr:hypothetical protein BC833DRAFT_624601 [Globomyces pollinis-pini]